MEDTSDNATSLRERVDDELRKSKCLLDVNTKLRADNNRLIKHLRNLAQGESESDVEALISEIDQLRMENDHLRNLLTLGTHPFPNEISSEADNYNRSLLSEHSSFYLMTPPRSPAHMNPTGKAVTRRTGRVGTSSPSQINSASANIRDIQLEELLPDIADVGPPMSPPPDTSLPSTSRRVSSADTSDTVDAHEAEIGSQEVDHDLSSSH